MRYSRRSYQFFGLFFIVLAVGFYLRWRNIETRPMHGDEANQAYQFELLLESGNYRYNPTDFHGPTLYFCTLPYYKIFGAERFADAQKRHLRGVIVFFSLLTAVFSLLFIDAIGRKGVLLLALMSMLAPSMVFYGTYYIQETLLLCFTVYFLGSLWRLSRDKSIFWAVNSGVALGLMHATKETFVLTCVALALAFGGVYFRKLKLVFKGFTYKHVMSFLTAGTLVSVLFYSSFLTNPQGPLDSVTAFVSHIKRGLGSDDFPGHITSGAGHTKGFFYYLENVLGYYPRKWTSTFWDIAQNLPSRPMSEIFFLVTTLGGVWVYRRKKGRQAKIFHLAVLFTAVLTLIYSLIPYKTPWCALTFLLGFMFCGAMYLAHFMQKSPKQNWIIWGVSLLFLVDLYRQSLLINEEVFATSHRNQFAYVQTVYDVEDAAKRIKEISQIDGRGVEMPIHFFTEEYWPFPWYLKEFNHIGYWEKVLPETDISQLPIVITDTGRVDVAEKLRKTHYAEYRSRMAGYSLYVYYRLDLWDEYMRNR